MVHWRGGDKEINRASMGQQAVYTMLAALNRLFITLLPCHPTGVKYQCLIGHEDDIFIMIVNVCTVFHVITSFRFI